jgi:hypothetical protein
LWDQATTSPVKQHQIQQKQVTASTCGSAYDTKLILATDPGDPGTYVCNDDDRACAYSAANSRLDAALKVFWGGAGAGAAESD